MLVLTRRLNESIVLPSLGVKITGLSVKGQAVRLGFDAPPGLRVDREEVWKRTQEEDRTLTEERKRTGSRAPTRPEAAS